MYGNVPGSESSDVGDYVYCGHGDAVCGNVEVPGRYGGNSLHGG